MVSDPSIAILMIALGALGVYAELCRPGKVLPGVVGGISLTTGVASLAKTDAPIPWRLTLIIGTPLVILTVFLVTVAVRARRNKLT
jgi:membrane-bound serine protease (ClpP class)